MLDSDARVWEECAKVLYDHVKLTNQTWESAAVRLRELARGDVRADLTTAQQQGAGRVPLSKTLDRWDSEDLTARLAAAERVVEAARGVVERWSRCETFIGIGGLSVDVAEYLAAYPPTPQTEVKG